MNQIPPDDVGLNPADKSPLEFYAAYIPGDGKQRHYLGNGKKGKQKGIRLFKSEEAAQNYIKGLYDRGEIPLEAYKRIVIHPVEGKLAVPADLQPNRIPFRNKLNLKSPDHLKPITTLHPPSVPTVVELLEQYNLRKRRPRRRK